MTSIAEILQDPQNKAQFEDLTGIKQSSALPMKNANVPRETAQPTNNGINFSAAQKALQQFGPLGAIFASPEVSGLAQGGQNQLEALKELLYTVTGRSKEIPALQNESRMANQQFEQGAGQNMRGRVGRFVGENAVTAVNPDLKIASTLANSGKLLNLLGKGAESIVKGAGQGAATYNPDMSVGEKATLGGILNPAIGSVGAAIPKVWKTLGNTKTVQEVLDTLKRFKAAGIKGAAGDVLGNKWLQDLQSKFIGALPLSGMGAHYEKARNALATHAKNIFDYFAQGEEPGSLQENVFENIKNRYEANDRQSNKLFNKAEKELLAAGASIDNRARQQAGKSILNDLKKSEKHSDTAAEDYKELRKDAESEAARLDSQDLEEGDIAALKALRNKYYLKGSLSPDKFIRNRYGRMSKAITNTISDSAENVGSKKASSLLNIANQHFKNNVAPYMHEKIAPFAMKDTADYTDIARKFLKAPTAQRSVDIATLKQVLSPEDTKRLIGHKLSNSLEPNGDVNPLKLKHAIDKLGNVAKTGLLSKNEQGMLSNYKELVEENPSLIKYFFNPQTGEQVVKQMGIMAALAPAGIGLSAVNRPMNSEILLKTLAKIQKHLEAGKKPTSQMYRNAFIHLLNQSIGSNQSEEE